MSTIKDRIASTKTYEDVEMLIHNICHTFLQQKGLSEYDYDEWHAEACMAFVVAHSTFDRRRGKFSTWLWHCVWNALCDKLRREAPHWTTLRHENRPPRDVLNEDGSGSLDRESLSDNGRAIVDLVLGTFGHVDGKQAEPGDLRVLIHDTLSGIGWSFARIVESFAEIRRALLN